MTQEHAAPARRRIISLLKLLSDISPTYSSRYSSLVLKGRFRLTLLIGVKVSHFCLRKCDASYLKLLTIAATSQTKKIACFERGRASSLTRDLTTAERVPHQHRMETKYSKHRTSHDLEDLDPITAVMMYCAGSVQPYISNPCARPSRSYSSHPAT